MCRCVVDVASLIDSDWRWLRRLTMTSTWSTLSDVDVILLFFFLTLTLSSMILGSRLAILFCRRLYLPCLMLTSLCLKKKKKILTLTLSCMIVGWTSGYSVLTLTRLGYPVLTDNGVWLSFFFFFFTDVDVWLPPSDVPVRRLGLTAGVCHHVTSVLSEWTLLTSAKVCFLFARFGPSSL